MGDRTNVTSRRDALRLGGMAVGIGAIAAACGDGRGGDDAPGRVGNAVVITSPEDFPVDDAVRLRTASSLEISAAELYEAALDLDVLASAAVPLVERLIDNHRGIADEMGALTEAAGGTAWTCNNPWYSERILPPIVETITRSDDVQRDLFTLAISFENLAVSTHQGFASLLTESAQRVAVTEAASLEARHSATLAIAAGGSEAYVSPALAGEDVPQTADGVFPNYAINSQFGRLGQIEFVVGPRDINGIRSTFTLQTPAENSYIYNELAPTC